MKEFEINRKDDISSRQEKFINKARLIHGDKYNYDKVLYVKGHSKVTITCVEHGDFLQSPSNHTHKTSPQGCPKCGTIRRGINKTNHYLNKRDWEISQPEEYKLIPLTRGKFSKVDNDDFEKLKTINWTLCSNGYVTSRKLNMFIHRFIMDCPQDMVVDHINHDTLDNRRINLRVCTQQENMYNSRPRKDSTSKYKGVYFDKIRGRIFSSIYHNGSSNFLGYYETEEEAALAYDEKAKEIFGEFANLNFK